MTDRSSPSGPPRLADFLCFAIYSANLAYGRAYKPILDELGVTYTQWIIIVALWEHDAQTVSELGEKLFLESNTLTPILKKLESLRLLERRRAVADERQVIITLTSAGRSLRTEGLQRTLVAATGLSRDEFAKTQRSVAKVRDNLIAHIKKSDPEPGPAAAAPGEVNHRRRPRSSRQSRTGG